MNVKFHCPGCKQTYTAPDSMAGMTKPCKKCGMAMVVPSPASAPPPPAAPSPPPQASPLNLTDLLEEAAAASGLPPAPAQFTVLPVGPTMRKRPRYRGRIEWRTVLKQLVRSPVRLALLVAFACMVIFLMLLISPAAAGNWARLCVFIGMGMAVAGGIWHLCAFFLHSSQEEVFVLVVFPIVFNILSVITIPNLKDHPFLVTFVGIFLACNIALFVYYLRWFVVNWRWVWPCVCVGSLGLIMMFCAGWGVNVTTNRQAEQVAAGPDWDPGDAGRRWADPPRNAPPPVPQRAGVVRPDTTVSLAEARRGFQTKITRRERSGQPVPRLPPSLFETVRYDSPAGNMAAYLSPRPPDGRRRPAIVWITGGDCNTIDDGVAQEGPPENDQSASAFRKAGIIMMFPSLRGGNDNPGFKEGFFGEVDDVIAAAEFLARRDFVDPARIYLGGHSTGGTLALLVAECSDRFRAVFSFGPVEDVVGYGPEFIFFNPTDQGERALRAPALWLHSIRRPVFVFEGTERSPNLSSLQALSRASTNPLARFYVVRGGDHFSILAPTTRLIAEKILADDGPTSNIAFAQEELASRLAVRTNPPGARLAQGPAERIEIPGPTVGPGPGRLVPDRFGPRVQPRQPGSGPGVGPGRPGFGPGVRPGGPAFGPRGLPAASQGRKTDLLGGPGGGPFETAGGGQPVLGFDYRLGSWAGQQALADFRPIYARGPQRAQPPFARGPLAAQQVMARDGYAVGALEVDAAEFVNAVRVVFMRIDAQGRLDPKDSYKSDWIGAASGRPTQTLGGDGSKVIGIYGRRTAVLDAVGLLLE